MRDRRFKIEDALFVSTPGGDPMINTLRIAGFLTPQAFYDFFYRVEPVNYWIVAKELPAQTLAALDPDVDDDKGFAKESLAHDPFRK